MSGNQMMGDGVMDEFSIGTHLHLFQESGPIDADGFCAQNHGVSDFTEFFS